MKVYDLVLAIIRMFVVLDLIRELANFVFLGVRLTAVMGATTYRATVVSESIELLSPVIGMIVSLIILAASRPIAAFAAKLATSGDTASNF